MNPAQAASSDLDLMELQAEALYVHDAAGRLLRVNEPDGGPAPRLFLGRTLLGDVRRYRHDLPEATARELDRLLDAEPPASDLSVLPSAYERVRAVLAADAPIEDEWFGPAWRFPDELPDAGDAVLVGGRNAAVLEPYFGDELPLGADQVCAAVVVGGAAVSLCLSSRVTPRAHEAGLETVEAYRGRGYAVRAAAAWAAEVRRRGRIPLYGTSWENHASRAVARRLGLVPYGADLSLR